MTGARIARTATALVTGGMLTLAAGRPLISSGHMAFAQTQPAGEQAAGTQPAGETGQQRAADEQMTQQAADQAVSNELQQTENLEFQTINEERPMQFQQPEP